MHKRYHKKNEKNCIWLLFGDTYLLELRLIGNFILRGNNGIWYHSVMKQIETVDCNESMRRVASGIVIFHKLDIVYAASRSNNDTDIQNNAYY